MTGLWVLAASSSAAASSSPVDSGPTGEAAKSGPLWAVVVGVLAVACYFLFRSMLTHLRRVREQFPDRTAEDRPSGGELAPRRVRDAGPVGTVGPVGPVATVGTVGPVGTVGTVGPVGAATSEAEPRDAAPASRGPQRSSAKDRRRH